MINNNKITIIAKCLGLGSEFATQCGHFSGNTQET